MILHGRFRLAFNPLGEMPWIIHHVAPIPIPTESPALHPVPIGAYHVTVMMVMTTAYDRVHHRGWFETVGVLTLHEGHVVIDQEPYACAKCKAKPTTGCYCDA